MAASTARCIRILRNFERRHRQFSTQQSPKQVVAVLYQASVPPPIGGCTKPLKPGGYSDSGADIAYALQSAGQSVVTPSQAPRADVAYDWVYPDTGAGIRSALDTGATTLWANTVLHSSHRLNHLDRPVRIVGSHPAAVEAADDKWLLSLKMREHGLPAANSMLIGDASDALPISEITSSALNARGIGDTAIVKPRRGRGSDGVVRVGSVDSAQRHSKSLFAKRTDSGRKIYGNTCIIEEYLPGEEVAVTVLPPGRYRLPEKEVDMNTHWSLPVVERFAHKDGVMPYSGEAPVVTNSTVLPKEAENDPEYVEIARSCVAACALAGAQGVARVDARRNSQGFFRIIDVNLKPNLTGPGRPGRTHQESLVFMAAKAIGCSYSHFLQVLLDQALLINPTR